MTTRNAIREDFKVGTKLICAESGLTFKITRNELDGVWLAKGQRGETCVFECEAYGWLVEV